jgi:hypothetical protein
MKRNACDRNLMRFQLETSLPPSVQPTLPLCQTGLVLEEKTQGTGAAAGGSDGRVDRDGYVWRPQDCWMDAMKMIL